MKPILALFAVAVLALTAHAEDVRTHALKDLNGYFPFQPPSSVSAWEKRKEQVQRQILVAAGLWPMPTKTPLNPVIHGKIDRGEYTIEKVYFESAPGFFVTGNLYRPKNTKGKVPGVLSAHGHAKDARLQLAGSAATLQSIAQGAERFESGGHSIYQSRCVQLARMGCVVWQWDMLGDSDSIQLTRDFVHGFAKQRPEMNTTENWGLFSPQAEAHCQNVLGLQLLNSVRSLDFLLSLPEVDPQRVAMTGESGGGTQTMLLSAIDDRIKLSFPVVMVSTSMQGGCTCENASLLRVNTGNIEFAALFAPKPQGMNTANDWTKELATKGFPDLQKLYALYGKKDNIFLLRGEHFPHNYNAVTRSAFYTFLNQHFGLGLPSPVIERDFEPLPREQLSVWDASHPAPKSGDPAFERQLVRWWTDDAAGQLRAAAATPAGLQQVVRPGLEALIGRNYSDAGTVEWDLKEKKDRDDSVVMSGTLRNTTYQEEVPVLWLYPKQWNGRVVIWLDDKGTGGLENDQVKKLVKSGTTVVGANLFYQGSEMGKKARTVPNPREFAGYTHGYNHSLFAQRTHDVLTIVTFLRNSSIGSHPAPKTVAIAAWGSTGPIAAAARALAGQAVDKAAIDTAGFRFGKVLDYRDPMFLPGGAKYLDIPGLLALNAPHALWVAGEGAKPEVFGAQFKKLVPFHGEANQKEAAAVEWLQSE
ncbi:MAG: acetylxylan esterase [Planctomycetaceae bacterium]|nr:acetylxylan esterase [Planctomycetaceae bacterium]